MNAEPDSDLPQALLRERCMAYLLGEMPASQARIFESELNDPVVAEALAKESDLICGLAESDLADQVLAPDHVTANPTAANSTAANQVIPEPSENASTTLRAVTRLISALAAVALLAAGYAFFPSTGRHSRQVAADLASTDVKLAIAKTWAEPAIDWAADSQAEDDLGIGSDLAEFDDPAELSSSEDEDSFDWMMAAVKASIGEGEPRNDG